MNCGEKIIKEAVPRHRYKAVLAKRLRRMRDQVREVDPDLDEKFKRAMSGVSAAVLNKLAD